MAAVTFPLPGLALSGPARRPAARPRPVPVPAATSAGTYRRRRLVVAVFASGVLLAAAWLLSARLGGGPLSTAEPPSLRTVSARTYVVQPGDTMWRVAQRLEPGRDPRPVVDALVAARGRGPLHVGERIQLP